MEAASPVRLIVCEVPGAGSKTLTDPYAAVAPYATCELEFLPVIQVIVAPDAVIADAVTPERVAGASRERVADVEEPFSVAVIVAV